MEFIRGFEGGKVTKRDIARAFGVKGPDKVEAYKREKNGESIDGLPTPLGKVNSAASR